MPVTTDFAQLFLRGLYWDSEDSEGTSLMDALKAAARAKLEDTTDGRILTGTSGNGHNVSFMLPGSGRGATPQDIAELVNKLIRFYESAPAGTDEEKLNWMLGRLVGRKRIGYNFRGMVK